MEVTLSDGTVIEILAINFQSMTVDWKRKEGYTGACVSPVEFTNNQNLIDDAVRAIETELALTGVQVN